MESLTALTDPARFRPLIVLAGRPEQGEWEYVLWLPSEHRTWRI